MAYIAANQGVQRGPKIMFFFPKVLAALISRGGEILN